MLECVEIEPAKAATAAVIWLHGLGADGNDFVPIIDELGLGDGHSVRFVFPNAPSRPVTVNNGMAMPAWYDIAGTDIADKQDADGIAASAREIEALIGREVERGIPPERIVLAGFSQGGAMALHTGLRQSPALAGVMALSAYLPLHDRLTDEAASASQAVSVFMAHGTEDPVVPIALGRGSRDQLVAAGYDVAWHEYPMAHQVCLPQIATIGRWLRTRL
ncbi:alpha/beta hydrolase [Salinisphaera sp. Q1T1-3]|uniref:alpha/beta hydrolase n=1 Tax=Salinisphaera sp. Q1T1-3 TaxID=2321229 RepID=UPI000E767894|nr:carboxylesterase [Salinisphaera sp. Q1T1-3]RJS92550.1 carboxylesterase [Salinisphaera sp. Q1T1-3]